MHMLACKHHECSLALCLIPSAVLLAARFNFTDSALMGLFSCPCNHFIGNPLPASNSANIRYSMECALTPLLQCPDQGSLYQRLSWTDSCTSPLPVCQQHPSKHTFWIRWDWSSSGYGHCSWCVTTYFCCLPPVSGVSQKKFHEALAK